MLFRTLSAPLPVLGQGLWHPQALPHHLHQDSMAKELLIKHLLKQVRTWPDVISVKLKLIVSYCFLCYLTLFACGRVVEGPG